MEWVVKDVFMRFGMPMVVLVDNAEFVRGSKGIERGHAPLTKSIAKSCIKDPREWPDRVVPSLFAKRISCTNRGYSPYIWKDGMAVEDLLIDIARFKSSLEYNLCHKSSLRLEPLSVGDWVLVYNSNLDRQWGRKLEKTFMGPFVIYGVQEGSYLLRELSGSKFKRPFSGDRLVLFPKDLQAEFEDKLANEATPLISDLVFQAILTSPTMEVSDYLCFNTSNITSELPKKSVALPYIPHNANRLYIKHPIGVGSNVYVENGIERSIVETNSGLNAILPRRTVSMRVNLEQGQRFGRIPTLNSVPFADLARAAAAINGMIPDSHQTAFAFQQMIQSAIEEATASNSQRLGFRRLFQTSMSHVGTPVILDKAVIVKLLQIEPDSADMQRNVQEEQSVVKILGKSKSQSACQSATVPMATANVGASAVAVRLPPVAPAAVTGISSLVGIDIVPQIAACVPPIAPEETVDATMTGTAEALIMPTIAAEPSISKKRIHLESSNQLSKKRKPKACDSCKRAKLFKSQTTTIAQFFQ
ncbi:hypothetical protein BDR26DRAFT_955314 [Obelidium mucronatum]|nr:hypothetical protein BDR26DRAFT_955314 [Obelidium mucronatum]